MARSAEVRELLDRVARDEYTDDDLSRLRRMVKVRGDGSAVRVGRYNVNLDNARNILVGDRVYRGVDAEILRDVLVDVAQGQHPRGWPRSFSGLIVTAGILLALGGMATFFYELWSLMGTTPLPGQSGGPPTEVILGFSLAVVGVIVAAVGQLGRRT